jgi:hypothetical protein
MIGSGLLSAKGKRPKAKIKEGFQKGSVFFIFIFGFRFSVKVKGKIKAPLTQTENGKRKTE